MLEKLPFRVEVIQTDTAAGPSPASIGTCSTRHRAHLHDDCSVGRETSIETAPRHVLQVLLAVEWVRHRPPASRCRAAHWLVAREVRFEYPLAIGEAWQLSPEVLHPRRRHQRCHDREVPA